MNLRSQNLAAHICIAVLLLSAISLSMLGCGVTPQPGSTSRTLAAAAQPTASSGAVEADNVPVASFTLGVTPGTISVAQGNSSTAVATVTIVTGYSHKIALTAVGAPSGVTVKLNPATIPAPGAGTSTMTVTASSTAPTGSYTLKVKAADGTNSAKVSVTLNVTTSSGGNPGATFTGCMYKTGGHSYQAVKISVKNPGTYPFYANLYSGATCSVWADDFGNGQLLNLGSGVDYIFWFDHFPDQTAMSAIWQVGSNTSKCLSYATAPQC